MRNALIVLTLVVPFLLGGCASTRSSSEPPPAAEAVAAADIDLSDPLPLDPAVRVGTLDNGLRYYIRTNTEPDNRAELYLAVDAGSILEDEEQRGLAHFVEHMLFNGTRRFPNEDLMAFLESTGMRFGPDVNAYTSFDETVYTLTIPTDSTEIVQKAFDVLEDWAGYATLSEQMIDKERGVVTEEWRMSDQNAQGRIQKQTLPVILHGSRYSERLPIGKPEVISGASYETIRRFYDTWYRPDLMAVIAVGDFNPDRFEALIREHFSSLENPEDEADRPSFEVPGHEETLFKVVTDPEFPVADVTVYFKKPAAETETLADYRRMQVANLFNEMINDRLDEIARSANPPFIGAQVFKGSFVRTAEFYGMYARVNEDSILTGLEAVLTEAARVRQHGFTASELERQKQETLRAYRQAYNERQTTNSSAFAQEYVDHFLAGEPSPGIEYEYEAVQRLLPGISLEEVNALAAELLQPENRAVIVRLPEKEGLTPPSEEDLQSVLESVQNREIAAYVDAVQDEPLLSEDLAPGTITRTETVGELSVTEITLSNGIRVVMKPTDFKDDEVQMRAFSPGGSSLVADTEAFEAETSPRMVARSGVGAFDRTELEKKLAGKVVAVSPFIGEIQEGFSGNASPEDLETLFQLIHLYFTAPRADPNALAALQNELRSSLINRSANPFSVYQDSLTAAMYGNDIRRLAPTIEMVNELELDESLEHYRERFANPGDFTFIFAGDFDVDTLSTLAQQYLGSLATDNMTETWRDVMPAKPDRVVQKEVHKGIGEQSWVALVFHGPFDFDRHSRHRIRSLAESLTITLRRELREERGGVYNVGVNAGTSAHPDSTYTFFINFGCAPDRVDELKQAVFDHIEKVKQEGPPEDVIATVKEQQRRERETQIETNGFWVNVLEFYYTHDEDMLDIQRYNQLIESLTAEDVKAAAQEYLDTNRYVEAILYPEAGN